MSVVGLSKQTGVVEALVSPSHSFTVTFAKGFLLRKVRARGRGWGKRIRGASVARDIVLEANWKPPEKQPTPKKRY
ncbi:hypothetical protein JTE90_022500 [Oedothorax gibbosus]|uniref:Ribosomal protein L2 n=1 Tax=Oedothorax gibbosus TaxID=931172 RepID=A0AAV6V1D6_9ARAC|nr:hypothetical protein JTE90_022500 [Oedothorax gibbosus]